MNNTTPPDRSCTERVARAGMRGVVAVEFLVAFPAIILFLLGVLQIMHGQVARLLVSHASHRAARAASLWLTEVEVSAMGGATEPVSERDAKDRIRAAAALTLAPLAPPTGRKASAGSIDVAKHARAIQFAFGEFQNERRRTEHWSADYVFDADVSPKGRTVAKATHAFEATRLVSHRFDDDTGRASVSIEYAYHCGFPVAGYFFCDAFSELPAVWRAQLSRAGLSPRGRYRIIAATAEFAVAPLPKDS